MSDASGSAAAPGTALQCRRVVKVFPSGTRALDELDLTVPEGAFFGLLGPTGAETPPLTGTPPGLPPPGGAPTPVSGDAAPPPRGPPPRRDIGYAPQDVALDRFVPVHDLLCLHGRYYGLSRADARSRADEMLAAFDLTAKAKATANQLSGGMRRRLLLARALLHRPRLVILDEPTAGVDVELRQDLWSYIRALHAAGTTILLTTHYLEEAEELCERVAFIREGRVVAEGSPPGLRERFSAERLEDVYLQLVGR